MRTTKLKFMAAIMAVAAGLTGSSVLAQQPRAAKLDLTPESMPKLTRARPAARERMAAPAGRVDHRRRRGAEAGGEGGQAHRRLYTGGAGTTSRWGSAEVPPLTTCQVVRPCTPTTRSSCSTRSSSASPRAGTSTPRTRSIRRRGSGSTSPSRNPDEGDGWLHGTQLVLMTSSGSPPHGIRQAPTSIDTICTLVGCSAGTTKMRRIVSLGVV